MSLAIPCTYYQQNLCRSCQWLPIPYERQVQRKQAYLQQQLEDFDQSLCQWLPPKTSPLIHFRNKAKMIVSGVVERPIFGILPDPKQPSSAVDLCHCPLYPPEFAVVLEQLKDFIARAGLTPYQVLTRKGELKYLLLTQSQLNGQFMLRFVLRSKQKIPLIQRELAQLQAKLPQLSVITANIQPQPAALLEGKEEIVFTEQKMLPEEFNRIPLFIRPQSFFQTNPTVAASLYATAQAWVQELKINHLWDLFCGVGGFGLHCTKVLQQKQQIPWLTGIEISSEAIASAMHSARLLGLEQVRFQALDSTQFALHQQHAPELVIVNPPRRGIGHTMAQFLNQTVQPNYILYSSCNPASMKQDLQALSYYQCQKIKLFDMFPHTSHMECMVLLSKPDVTR